MGYRKEELSDGEIYHIYNRGVDKRITFEDKQDFFQFLQMLDLFNNEESCGGIDQYKYPKNLNQRNDNEKLVEIIAYCLKKNHYHLLLRQIGEHGVSKFMQKIGTGYTKYFNQKNDRTGPLFSGGFKSKHVGTDEYLKGLSAYINLNNLVHEQTASKQPSRTWLFYRSSWWEYGGDEVGEKEKDAFHAICEKGIILEDFKDKQDYMKFAKGYVKNIVRMRKSKLELDSDRELFLE